MTGRYNIVVDVGKAGELSRMHVHVHLMPRYLDDVPTPKSVNVLFEEGWNPSLSGEVNVRHAGERRHPGSFSVHDQKSPGFRRNDRSKSRLPVDQFRTLGLEPRVDQFNLRLNLIFPLGRIASVVNLTFPYYRPRDP